MKILICGLGYVGLTSAACALKSGHEVWGFDISSEKVASVASGRSPIYEPGLDDLLSEGIASGRLSAVTQLDDRIAGMDLALVCVGTPSQQDGSHNMTYIAEASRQIAVALARSERKTPLTVTYRSTMRPGSMTGIVVPVFASQLGADSGKVELVYNPEFLRESTAISDYFSPPKIVIGTADGQPSATVDALYDGIAAPRFYTRFPEAEITKFVDNSFHALKVAFANEVGRIAMQYGVCVRSMHEIFVADTKLNISPYYLRPGGAFGGSCLPKDVRALVHMSKAGHARTHVIDSLIQSNEDHKRFLFDTACKALPASADILLNGLAFKDKSDDLRESPLLDMAVMALDEGHRVTIFEPYIDPRRLHGANLGFSMSHLPQLADLMVQDPGALKDRHFDLVIDGRGTADRLPVTAGRVFNVARLL